MASNKLTAEQQHLFDALAALQKRFVTWVLKGKNQTDPYRKAGGKAKGEGTRKAAHAIVTWKHSSAQSSRKWL